MKEKLKELRDSPFHKHKLELAKIGTSKDIENLKKLDKAEINTQILKYHNNEFDYFLLENSYETYLTLLNIKDKRRIKKMKKDNDVLDLNMIDIDEDILELLNESDEVSYQTIEELMMGSVNNG